MPERIAQSGNARNTAVSARPPATRGIASYTNLPAPEQRLALLQQTIGNQGVLRRMEAGLRINDVNDSAEREADRVADRVMSAPQSQPAAAASVSASGNSPAIQRKCASCAEEDEEVQVQRKESSVASPGVSASATATSPPIVNQVLNSPGQPLDRTTRSFMEERLGHDFSRVRVHADERAAESARAVSAVAYTVANDLVFASGQYSPASTRGKSLLAHELVHVMQNNGGSPAVNPFTNRESSHQDALQTGKLPQAYSTKPAAVNRAASGVLRRTASPQDIEAQAKAKQEHEKEQRKVNDLTAQMAKVKPDPAKGWDDPDNLLSNALQWLPGGRGSAKAPITFVVMSPTHDTASRNPSAGSAYFDARVHYPEIGGDYPADPAVKTHPAIAYEQPGAPATTNINEIHLYTSHYFDYESLRQRLIHEVQHVADQSRLYMFIGAAPGQLTWAAYRTEFRAYWIQPEPPQATGFGGLSVGPSMNFGSSQDPATNSQDVTVANPQNCSTACNPANQKVKTHFRNLRQENIFWYLLYYYKYRGFDCLYVCDPQFRKNVDDFAFPEGFNLANSVRIEDLNDAVERCSPQMNVDDPAVLHVLAAARRLTSIDRQFLQDTASSASFWNRVQSHIPQGMVDIISNLARTGREIEEHFEDLPRQKGNRGLA